MQKLKKEHDATLKALATAKKQLEEETIARVDLENRIQSLKEELSFKAQVHEQVIIRFLLVLKLWSFVNPLTLKPYLAVVVTFLFAIFFRPLKGRF